MDLKPAIGVTSSMKDGTTLTSSMDNAHSIIQAGGVPFVLANIAEESVMERMAELLDGLLAAGGGDVDPMWYGEEPHPALGEVTPERDGFEIALIRKFLERNKPVFGICRGCQVLNVAADGSLYQDIHAQAGRPLLQHAQKAPRGHATHAVEVTEPSLLHRIVRTNRLRVNSFHHQAVHRAAEGFAVTARSSDGIVEAIESERHRFVLGVQWHPEHMTMPGDPAAKRLFEAFVEACRTQGGTD